MPKNLFFFKMKYLFFALLCILSLDMDAQTHTFNLLGRFRMQTQNATVVTEDIKSQIDSFQFQKLRYRNAASEIVLNYETQKRSNYTSFRIGYNRSMYEDISTTKQVGSDRKYDFKVRESSIQVGVGKGVSYHYQRLNFQAGGLLSLYFIPQNKIFVKEILIQDLNNPNETTYTRIDEFPATLYSNLTFCSRVNFKLYKRLYFLTEYNMGLSFFFQKRNFSRRIISFDSDGNEIDNYHTKVFLEDKSIGTVNTSPAIGFRYVLGG